MKWWRPAPYPFTRRKSSPLWHSLSPIRDDLRSNIAWSVGNGLGIRFWDDIWIPQLGPLRPHALDPSYINKNINISDLVTVDGSWNLEALECLLPSTILPYILSIRPPSSSDVADSYIWRLQVPQRIRLFLWTTFRHKLMTNLERSKRSFTDDPSLWDCVITANRKAAFYSLNLEQWIISNIHQVTIDDTLDVPWNLLFSPLVWQQKPPTGWFCLNTDGSVSTGPNFGSIGGAFRDVDVNWIIGFPKAIGITTPLQIGLWAIFHCLEVASHHGFELLLIQSDCADAMNLVNDSNSSLSPTPHSLVRSIHQLRQRCWVTEVIWVPHESNKLADGIAKLSPPPMHALALLSSPPSVHVKSPPYCIKNSA
ncbi:hypothetical protein F3Y22_tig00117016pilonHSYRG00268 [Hibiscus syriacus]|uniref:RNase H type-1 domain-containing protein n=1 Tax=Hibiscus syriacus TaxID=106335 RepID=A0A6A2WCH4_HIBSY|nr:hypothetical protein F3Y22_tig00117016pilonHSYRG00268 [Hibiscus syriacus]